MINSKIYGELTFKGIMQLFEQFDVKKGDKFCDIGSGYGKTTVAYNHYFKEFAYGIEIEKEKHQIAKKIWINRPNKYKFINSDYRNNFEIIDECKFIYCNCICFPWEEIEPLFKYMAYRKTPGILIHNSTYFKTVGLVPLDVCWSDNPSKYYKLTTQLNR